MTDAIRALTVKQPFADLIMDGVKDVENRRWPVPSTLPQWWRCVDGPVDGESYWMPERDDEVGPCDEPVGPFPFRLGIHAAAQGDGSDEAQGAWWEAIHADLTPGLHKGALLGTVEVTGCHHADECDHICPEAGCDDCDGPLGNCGHEGSWPAIDATGDAIPCDVRRGEACNNHCSRWAEPDAWHWTMRDPRPLDVPVPMRGMLGLWRLPSEVVA